MVGNQIDQFTRQGSQKTVGAVLTMLLAMFLLVLMFYYLRTTREGATSSGRADERWLRNPWGRPRFLRSSRALYIVWSLVPV